MLSDEMTKFIIIVSVYISPVLPTRVSVCDLIRNGIDLLWTLSVCNLLIRQIVCTSLVEPWVEL